MRIRMVLAALPIVTMIQSQAARAQTREPVFRTVLLSSAQASVPTGKRIRIVREIDDPHNGTRWLLIRNSDHPAGPGVLMMVSDGATGTRQRKSDGATLAIDAQALSPVIRAGERLIVEESTPVVEARLEAVSLGPAAVGSPLDVRLKVGGKVVRAVALGPGRAALRAETGVRP